MSDDQRFLSEVFLSKKLRSFFLSLSSFDGADDMVKHETAADYRRRPSKGDRERGSERIARASLDVLLRRWARNVRSTTHETNQPISPRTQPPRWGVGWVGVWERLERWTANEERARSRCARVDGSGG